jgi:hypothetical protein
VRWALPGRPFKRGAFRRQIEGGFVAFVTAPVTTFTALVLWRLVVQHGGVSVYAQAPGAVERVADREAGDGIADRIDHAGQLHAEDPLLAP